MEHARISYATLVDTSRAPVSRPAGAAPAAKTPPAVAVADISVIIPARDEGNQVAGAIDSARRCPVREIIVADGRSRDQTVRIAQDRGARVVTCAPGRGPQLHAGAQAARGAILLFLHADTRLPPDYAHHVLHVLARPGVVAGAFRLRIDAPHRALRLVERAVHWRCRWLHLPYGDQALFLTRQTYERVGGFPPIPLMEDYVFVRRLRRLGRIAIAPAEVTTSARRWLREGIWRTTLHNQLSLLAYHFGTPPERIAAWRARR